MTSLEQIETETDVDVLWHHFTEARERGDAAVERAAQARMRELTGERRFAHLTDEELEARLASLSSNRLASDMLAASPGGGATGDAGVADLMLLNQQIRDGQHVGVETTRAALLDELARRHADEDRPGDG